MFELTPPAFSVIIPTYNRAQVILRAVQSVLAQTWQDFELIVVDDGSTDNTCDLFEAIQDSRIRYLYQQNRGVSAARNAGAAQSTGQFLAFLDSDDEVHTTWLKRFRDMFVDEDAGIACVGFRETRTGKTVLPASTGLFRAGTFSVRRHLFSHVCGYVEQLRQGENTELGIRLTEACRIAGLEIRSCPRPLLVYRNVPDADPKRYRDRYRHRLDNSLYMLETHDSLMNANPQLRTQYLSIAGVNAARVGQYGEARQYFRDAIRNSSTKWRNYGRLAIAYCPPLARRLWEKD